MCMWRSSQSESPAVPREVVAASRLGCAAYRGPSCISSCSSTHTLLPMTLYSPFSTWSSPTVSHTLTAHADEWWCWDGVSRAELTVALHVHKSNVIAWVMTMRCTRWLWAGHVLSTPWHSSGPVVCKAQSTCHAAQKKTLYWHWYRLRNHEALQGHECGVHKYGGQCLFCAAVARDNGQIVFHTVYVWLAFYLNN